MSKSYKEGISHRENWNIKVISLMIQFYGCKNGFVHLGTPSITKEIYEFSRRFEGTRPFFYPCSSGGYL